MKKHILATLIFVMGTLKGFAIPPGPAIDEVDHLRKRLEQSLVCKDPANTGLTSGKLSELLNAGKTTEMKGFDTLTETENGVKVKVIPMHYKAERFDRVVIDIYGFKPECSEEEELGMKMAAEVLALTEKYYDKDYGISRRLQRSLNPGSKDAESVHRQAIWSYFLAYKNNETKYMKQLRVLIEANAKQKWSSLEQSPYKGKVFKDTDPEKANPKKRLFSWIKGIAVSVKPSVIPPPAKPHQGVSLPVTPSTSKPTSSPQGVVTKTGINPSPTPKEGEIELMNPPVFPNVVSSTNVLKESPPSSSIPSPQAPGVKGNEADPQSSGGSGEEHPSLMSGSGDPVSSVSSVSKLGLAIQVKTTPVALPDGNSGETPPNNEEKDDSDESKTPSLGSERRTPSGGTQVRTPRASSETSKSSSDSGAPSPKAGPNSVAPNYSSGGSPKREAAPPPIPNESEGGDEVSNLGSDLPPPYPLEGPIHSAPPSSHKLTEEVMKNQEESGRRRSIASESYLLKQSPILTAIGRGKLTGTQENELKDFRLAKSGSCGSEGGEKAPTPSVVGTDISGFSFVPGPDDGTGAQKEGNDTEAPLGPSFLASSVDGTPPDADAEGKGSRRNSVTTERGDPSVVAVSRKSSLNFDGEDYERQGFSSASVLKQ